jgi:MSHA biogenesis protein MshP
MISFFARFSGSPSDSRVSLPGRQRGVSIITGVFLLLLMAVLAAVIASVVSTAHVNQAADIGGARAYQAARAGVEWGMYQLDPNAQAAGLPACVNGAPAIPGHAVAVTCTSDDYTEGPRQIRIYRIVSLATATGVKAPGIERRVEVTIEKCRDATITAAPSDC